MFPNGIGYTESISGGKEDTVNLNCSENDQQWRARWGGGGVCVRKHGGHREEDRVTGGMQGRERSKKGKEGGGRRE